MDALNRLKVRLGDYEALEPSDRSLWVIDLVDQEVSGPLRNGVSRFESLLQVFGLDGAVEDELRKTLFELSQIRHVILHRHGEADKKLLDSCPWLPFHLGEPVKITHEMYHRYHVACDIYRTALIQRVRAAYELAPLKELEYAKELQVLRGDTRTEKGTSIISPHPTGALHSNPSL